MEMPQPFIPGRSNRRRKRRVVPKIPSFEEPPEDSPESTTTSSPITAGDNGSAASTNTTSDESTRTEPGAALPAQEESSALSGDAPPLPFIPGRTRRRKRTAAQRAQDIRNRVSATDRVGFLNHTMQRLTFGSSLSVQFIDQHGDCTGSPFEIQFTRSEGDNDADSDEAQSNAPVAWSDVLDALSGQGHTDVVPMANLRTPHDLHLPVPRLDTLLIMSRSDFQAASREYDQSLLSATPKEETPNLVQHYREARNCELTFERFRLLMVLCLAVEAIVPYIVLDEVIDAYRIFERGFDILSFSWIYRALRVLGVFELIFYLMFRLYMRFSYERKVKDLIEADAEWLQRQMDSVSSLAGYADGLLQLWTFLKRLLVDVVVFAIASLVVWVSANGVILAHGAVFVSTVVETSSME